MRTRVKLCGLTTTRDVEVAVETGADALGFVLSPSPRRVAAERLHALLAAVPSGIERVAVLSTPGADELALLVRHAWDAVQIEAEHADALVRSLAHLAGTGPPGIPPPPPPPVDRRNGARVAQELRGSARTLPVVPAHRDGERALTLLETESRRPATEPDQGTGFFARGGVHLLDGPGGGGLGVPAAAERVRRATQLPGLRLVIAGGLDPDSVGTLVDELQPYGVDVSSGIERARGVKDPARMRAFVEAARGTARGGAR